MIQTVAAGMVIGLGAVLIAHALLVATGFGHVSAWIWSLVALGGTAVGGACALFARGAATDRGDTGPEPRGSERAEWQRTLDRRRRHAWPYER